MNDLRAFERGLARGADATYELCLYVTGMSPRSLTAIANIRSICEQYLAGRYRLTIVDIGERRALASTRQLLAAPTLVKEKPLPTRRVIGDLSNRSHVLQALGV